MGFFHGIGILFENWCVLTGWLNAVQAEQNSAAYTLIFLACTVGCALIAYLLGSINPAIIISKLFYGEDIRTKGSGNAGSTNMLRNYGKGAAALTFVLDLLKAAVAVTVGFLLLGRWWGSLASLFVVLGHIFPIFYRFRGGKGVACLAMVALMQSPVTFLILLALFIIIVVGTRYVSLGSVMGAMLYPLILQAFSPIGLNVAMAIICAVIVILKHLPNLKRLWAGQESKVSFKKKKTTEDADNGAETK